MAMVSVLFPPARASVTVWRAILRLAAPLLLLAACAANLAPPYDAALVAGLNGANVKTLTLFSAVSGGSGAGAFPALAPRYDEVIGTFDALRIQAKARPTPNLPEPIRAALAEGGQCPDPADCVNPTPEVLAEIGETLATMRQVHAAGGLAADLVPGFKLAYETSIGQALAVETAFLR